MRPTCGGASLCCTLDQCPGSEGAWCWHPCLTTSLPVCLRQPHVERHQRQAHSSPTPGYSSATLQGVLSATRATALQSCCLETAGRLPCNATKVKLLCLRHRPSGSVGQTQHAGLKVHHNNTPSSSFEVQLPVLHSTLGPSPGPGAGSLPCNATKVKLLSWSSAVAKRHSICPPTVFCSLCGQFSQHKGPMHCMATSTAAFQEPA
jgi:hypothetical protein